MQRGNLLGNDADKKSEDCRNEQQGTHIGETPGGQIGVEVVANACPEESRADGDK